MAITSRNKVNPQFSMSSMTDIVFLLLIFFLVATTLLKKERDLDMRLPGPPDETTERQPQLPVVILVIDGETRLYRRGFDLNIADWVGRALAGE